MVIGVIGVIRGYKLPGKLNSMVIGVISYLVGLTTMAIGGEEGCGGVGR